MPESSVEIDDDLRLGIAIGLAIDDLRLNCKFISADGLIKGVEPAQHDAENM